MTKSPIEQARELISELVRFREQQPTLPAEVQLEFIADLFARIAVSQQELTTYAESLEREIKVLRQWGNKECTAMADEELERLRKTGE